MKARVGGILKGFSIHRADGTVERYDQHLHNVMNDDILTDAALFASAIGVGGATYRWDTAFAIVPCQVKVKEQLVGTYSQSGNIITRVSGEDLTLGTYFWESIGTAMMSYAGGTGTQTVHGTATVPAGTDNLWIIREEFAPNSGLLQPSEGGTNTAAARVTTYLGAGVFSSKNTTVIVSRIYTGTYTIKSIAFTGPNTVQCNTFDLPSPIVLNPGDRFVVGIGDFEVTYTLDAYQPRALGTCPITGITTSCVVQRCFRFNSTVENHCNDTQSATRIWLLDTANKLTLPPDVGLINAIITPPTTTLLTITATGTSIAPARTNQFLRENKGVGTISSTQTGVKQIVWGNTTMVFGILEFDTPQTLEAGKVLTIGGRLWIEQDLDLSTP